MTAGTVILSAGSDQSCMEIRETFRPIDRRAWRQWLQENHDHAQEIWVLLASPATPDNLSYLDSVEEALCFGWIDSIQKRYSPEEVAQRFSRRKPRGNWTELNKERARRLIRLGLMTPAGAAILPDLDEEFLLAPEIEEALKAESGAWENFQTFPALYQRIRVGYVMEQKRTPDEFARRLSNFVKKTVAGEMFGNWNDGGRLGPPSSHDRSN